MNDAVARLDQKLLAWQISIESREEDKARQLADGVYQTVLGKEDSISRAQSKRCSTSRVPTCAKRSDEPWKISWPLTPRTNSTASTHSDFKAMGKALRQTV